MSQTPKEHYEAGIAALNRAQNGGGKPEGRAVMAGIAQAHFLAGLLALSLPPVLVINDPGAELKTERKGGF